jgi:hypothetical protein
MALFALMGEFLREVVAERGEEFCLAGDFSLPLSIVQSHDFGECFLGEASEALGVEIGERRTAANLGFDGIDLAVAAFHDPLEDSHVFAVAGPYQFAFAALAA